MPVTYNTRVLMDTSGVKQSLRLQILLIFASLSLFFWQIDIGFSVLCGGLISLANGVISIRHQQAQQSKTTLNAHASLVLVWKSLFIRLSLIIVLIGFGLWLGLNAKGLVAGFVVGQIAFLMDRLRVLKTKHGK